MYHPTSRVLAVLSLLQSHERMTGAEMARRLEINIRTLRRYITTLQDMGIPIIADRGRSGAYTLGAGFQLPPMMFTNEEALALEIGLVAAAQLRLAESARAIQSARAKLELVMPHELKIRAAALSDSVQLDMTGAPAPPSSQIMLVIGSATQAQRRVHLRYLSDQNEETERDFDSYGIACLRGRWYAVGWCHLRDALRSFRLDRMLEAELTNITFERSETFDPLAHVEQSIATLARAFRFTILLKTDLATAQREIYTMFGILEPHENGVLLRGTATDLQWVARVLSSVSFAFEILEPDGLRPILREHAARLGQLADG